MGGITVRPSLRTVEGPSGRLIVEPRVMQVLLAFVDAGGAVLSREDLMRQCWSGMVVGDDAVNRAVAEVRRAARESGARFSIETIPRIGYRLAVSVEGSTAAVSAPPLAPGSRRWFLGGAAAVGLVGAGLLFASMSRRDPRFEDLLDQGRQALRTGLPDAKAQGVDFLREAVAIEPSEADAWGLLALAERNVAEYSFPREAAAAVAASEEAARRALSIDPREPNALTALALLQRKLDDWSTTERKLRAALDGGPRNAPTLDALTALTQAAGLGRESWDYNEQSIAVDPLRPGAQQRRALKHWILGRPVMADQVIARALELWPAHPYVWNARLLISAFTGQDEAATRLLDEQHGMLTPAAVAVWRASIAALATRSATAIAIARDASLAAAPRSPGLAAQAIMTMSALGEVDVAYSIIDGLLLRRGALVTESREKQGMMPEDDPQWRQTQWLFTPATKSLRLDSRFAALCQSIGLADYWHARGMGPDEDFLTG